MCMHVAAEEGIIEGEEDEGNRRRGRGGGGEEH